MKISPKMIAIPRVPKNEPPVTAPLGVPAGAEPAKFTALPVDCAALVARVLPVFGTAGLIRGSVSSDVLKPGLTVSYRPASTRSDSVYLPTGFQAPNKRLGF